MGYAPDEPTDPVRAAIAGQIEKTAKLQHLTGMRRESFVDAVSLCGSCMWAQSRRRGSRNNKQMECQVFSGPCPEDITECSEYRAVGTLSLNQMAEIAHLIDNNDPKKVGFHKE